MSTAKRQVINIAADTQEVGLSGIIDKADVGADGRSSIVRDKAGLQVKEFGAPMDVLWFRLETSHLGSLRAY